MCFPIHLQLPTPRSPGILSVHCSLIPHGVTVELFSVFTGPVLLVRRRHHCNGLATVIGQWDSLKKHKCTSLCSVQPWVPLRGSLVLVFSVSAVGAKSYSLPPPKLPQVHSLYVSIICAWNSLSYFPVAEMLMEDELIYFSPFKA